MAKKRVELDIGLRLRPSDQALSKEGDVSITATTPRLKARIDSADRTVVTEDQSQTLTNKTIDVASNTVSNIDTTHLAAGVLDTDLAAVSASDDTIPSAKATKDYVDAQIAGKDEASEIAYSNATSGLTATDVQAAIDEVEGRVDTAETDIGNLETLSGSAPGSTDHGTFTGTTIPDSSTTKAALQALETEVETKADDSALTSHLSDTSTHGITSAIVGTDETQTLINKTIDGDNNTVEDLPLTAIKTDLPNASKFIERDASGIPISGKAVPTGDVVGTSDAQVITGKDIDGGTASNTSRITIPKAAKATLDALTRKEGTLVYAADEDKLYADDGSSLLPVGAGAGSLDIFHQEDFEITTAASIDGSGNNGTFDNGGALNGAVSDETTSPIEGTRSLKYTAGAASQNDWIKIKTITLDDKQKGTFIKEVFYADSSNFAVDSPIIVHDGTNELTSSLDIIPASTDKSRYEIIVFVPEGTASISYGFHFTNTPVNTETLIVDSFEFTTDVSNSGSLLDTQELSFVALGSTMTSSTTGVLRWGTIVESGDSILSYDDSNGRFVANRKCTVDASVSLISTSAGFGVDLRKDGSAFISQDGGTASTLSCASSSIVLEKDEYIDAEVFANLDTTGTQFLRFVATAEVEHVITPVKSNMTDWQSYSPTLVGFGTPSGEDFHWRQNGDSMQIRGKFVVGASTATQAQLPLPGSHTVKSGLTGNQGVGHFFHGSATTSGGGMIATSGDAFVKFTQYDLYSLGGVVPTATANGNAVGDSGDTITITLEVPIEGWTSDVTFLAAVPSQRTAFLKDVKVANTSGGTSPGTSAYNARTLGTLSGDTGWISLSANRWTISKGKYKMRFRAPGYQVDAHKAKIVQDPAGSPSDLVIGSSARSAAASGVVTWSEGETIVELTGSTTFELQHRLSGTSITDGLGIAANLGEDEVYASVEIIKLS